jgi:hypothetical protein
MQEEIFGPVVTVSPFDSPEEAVGYANGSRYGLSASVWTRDLGRAHRIAAALESGTVWVNTWLMRDLRVPFGGMKDSGVGRERIRFARLLHRSQEHLRQALKFRSARSRRSVGLPPSRRGAGRTLLSGGGAPESALVAEEGLSAFFTRTLTCQISFPSGVLEWACSS